MKPSGMRMLRFCSMKPKPSFLLKEGRLESLKIVLNDKWDDDDDIKGKTLLKMSS